MLRFGINLIFFSNIGTIIKKVYLDRVDLYMDIISLLVLYYHYGIIITLQIALKYSL